MQPQGIISVNETDCVIKGQRPETGRANTPLREAHTSGALGGEMAVMVRHIAVEEVVVVPADDSRVRTDPAEGAMDVFRSDGVEGAPNVQKRGKAVGAGVNVAFDVVRQR